MQVYSNATSLIRTVRLVDDAGDPITAVAYNDASLEVAVRAQSAATWTVLTLVDGTLGSYLANSWKADPDGDGLHQLCLPNSVVVAGTATNIRVTYGANSPQYDTVEAVLVDPESIAALNDLDSTAVQAAAAAALTAYDPPTNAELEARTLDAADYATSTALSAVATNASTAASQSTTAATQATASATNTNTLLNRVTTGAAQLFADLIAMITGSNTADPQWTADALALGPSGGGGGGSGDAEQTTLLEVQSDVRTLLGLTGDGSIPPNGYVDGLTTALVPGDDYTTDVGRLIRINLVDSNGDPASTEFGSKSLADEGVSIKMLLQPSAKTTGTATVVGSCEFVPAPDVNTPSQLEVSLPRAQTALAKPGSYDLQCEAVWSDGFTVTFFPYGKLQFTKDIRRPAS